MENLKNKAYRALRSSESFFKTDMVYLAQGSFWLGIGHVVSVLSGLILLIAFANLLPKEAFGAYQYVISIAAIVSIFTLTGMSTSVMLKSAHGSQSILRYAVRTQLRWSSIMILLSGALSIYYYYNDNNFLAVAMLIVGVTQPFMTGFALYKPYLLGREQFRISTIADLGQRIIPFVSIIMALFLKADPLIILATYFLSHSLSYYLVYLYTVKKFAPAIEPDEEALNYSKHISFMSGLEHAASNADKVLVWTMLGAAPVAIYTLAQTPIIHLQAAFGLLRSLVFPKIARKDLSELKALLPGKIRTYFFFALLAVAAYIMAAPLIFKTFFPQYLDSIRYSQVLALTVLAIPRMLIGETFSAHQMKRELYILGVSVPMVRLTLMVILLPLFGIWGAIITILITEWFTAILQWRLFLKLKTS